MILNRYVSDPEQLFESDKSTLSYQFDCCPQNISEIAVFCFHVIHNFDIDGRTALRNISISLI